MLTLARFNAMFIYSANDVTSKCYYTSVISFLLNGFITLLRRVLCDKRLLYFFELDIKTKLAKNVTLTFKIINRFL
jgi:hypothetical protein